MKIKLEHFELAANEICRFVFISMCVILCASYGYEKAHQKITDDCAQSGVFVYEHKAYLCKKKANIRWYPSD